MSKNQDYYKVSKWPQCISAIICVLIIVAGYAAVEWHSDDVHLRETTVRENLPACYTIVPCGQKP